MLNKLGQSLRDPHEFNSMLVDSELNLARKNEFNDATQRKISLLPLNADDYINANEVNHGNLRDDRPTHGRVGRAIGTYLCVSVSECHGKPVCQRSNHRLFE
jgi:hypothetical protein